MDKERLSIVEYWVKAGLKKKIKDFLEHNDNERHCTQIMVHMKVVLTRKFISLSVYIKKRDVMLEIEQHL